MELSFLFIKISLFCSGSTLSVDDVINKKYLMEGTEQCGYMKKKEIKFDDMKPYLEYYPERIYKNMYEVGLLNGVSA